MEGILNASASRPLRHQILIFVALPIVVLMMLVVVFTSARVSSALNHELRLRLDASAAQAAEMTDSKLRLATEACESIAQNDVVVNGIVDLEHRESTLQPYFRSLVLPGAPDQHVVMTDYRGRPIASSHQDPRGFTDASWLDEVIEQGQSHVSITDARVTIAVPVICSGRPEATIVAMFSLEEFLSNLVPTTSDQFHFFSLDNAVVASSRPFLVDVGTESQPVEGWISATATSNAFTPLRVTVLESESLALASNKTVNNAMMVQMAILMLGLLGAISLTTRLITKPLSRCLGSIEQVQQTGDLSLRVETSGTREIAELGIRFNSMVSELESTTVSVEDLRSSQEQLDLALISANIGLFDWDAVTNKVYFSPTAKTQLGYSEEENWTTFSEWESRLHPDDRTKAIAQVNSYLAKKTDEYDSTYRLRRNDGTYLWVLSRGKASRAPDGSVARVVGVNIDIHDRKIAEHQLQLTQHAVDNSADGVFFIRPDGSLRYANRQAMQYLGYSIDELRTMKIHQIASIVNDVSWTTRWDAIKEAKNIVFDSVHLRKNGSSYECNVNAWHIDFEGEEVIVASFRDTTKQNRETFLRKTLFEGSIDGQLLRDHNGIVECNLAAAKMLGFQSKGEMLVHHPSYFSPEFQPDGQRSIEKAIEMDALAYKSGFHQYEWVHTRITGEDFPVQVTLRLVELDTGPALLTIWHDLTSIRAKEEELASTGRLIEQSLNEVYIFDVDSLQITFVNRGALQNLGYESEEILNLTPLDLNPHHNHAQFRALIRPLVRGEQERLIYHSVHRRKDGSLYNVEVHLQHSAFRGKNSFIAIVLDVTERIRNEEMLRRVNQELKRSNEDLEQFAYVASHDLQEPLRKVSAFCELLEEDFGDKLDEEGKRYMGYIVDGAGRMRNLIRDLLAFSRVKTQGGAFSKIELEPCLHAALANLSSAIEESQAKITFSKMPTVCGDHRLFTQLFQNLIGNSVKYRGDKKPRIHVGVESNQGDWIISVADNGIGIEPQYRDKVFGVFKRLHSRDEYPGTGIGLAICARIVERMNGRIWTDSNGHGGSTFHFSIPKNATAELRSTSNWEISLPAQ